MHRLMCPPPRLHGTHTNSEPQTHHAPLHLTFRRHGQGQSSSACTEEMGGMKVDRHSIVPIRRALPAKLVIFGGPKGIRRCSWSEPTDSWAIDSLTILPLPLLDTAARVHKDCPILHHKRRSEHHERRDGH